MTVLVAGEALIDIVAKSGADTVEHVGGSPCNVAIGLGRLGRPVRLVTDVGDDPRGLRIRERLADSGVTLVATPAGTTSTARARLSRDGAATYSFDLRWAPADPGPLPDVAWVHTGSIAGWLEPGCTTVAALTDRHRQTAVISYDPNLRPALIADEPTVRARIQHLVETADVVKASADDLSWWAPGVKPVDVARDWLSRGPALVVVTLGAGGALAMTQRALVRAPVVPVQVADTVGAGDAFMSALIDGLLRCGVHGSHGRDALRPLGDDRLRAVVGDGVAAAAISVQRAGAEPAWPGELQRD